MSKESKEVAKYRMEALFDLHGIIAYAEGQLKNIQKIQIDEEEYTEEYVDLMRGYAERVRDICLDMKDLGSFGKKGKKK